jgi:hypothetical protein
LLDGYRAEGVVGVALVGGESWVLERGVRRGEAGDGGGRVGVHTFLSPLWLPC